MKTGSTQLRRWVAFSVKDDRSQRKRAREIDESITRLEAAQLVSEEKVQRIRSLGRNGN